MTDKREMMIECRGLSKRYEEIVALEELNLAIPRGHVFGYIGHNGAGKTTTIRILAGLLTPTSGTARIAGVDARDRGALRRRVGYMPDQFGVYDRMRVWEYLDFFGAAFKIPRAARKDRLEFVLDITEAQYMRDRFVDTLSLGMKQRVGIARTLMHDPDVMLLDEPASGLDPQARVQMRHLLRKLADAGKTLMVSSHILPELAAVCDSIGIIHKGRLRAAGPIGKVLAELQRDRLMELRASAGLTTAANLLSESSRCREIDDSELATGVLRFRFTGDDEAQGQLLGDLVNSHVRLVSFREVPLSLEDAYLAISSQVPEAGETPGPEEPGETEAGGKHGQ